MSRRTVGEVTAGEVTFDKFCDLTLPKADWVDSDPVPLSLPWGRLGRARLVRVSRIPPYSDSESVESE